jgi:tRNA-Thr(GGU) m(6)t(6)A37 methyltransferase TsaA
MDTVIKKTGSASSSKILNTHKKITYTPIGTIHSPFKELAGIPKQPEMGHGVEGVVEVFPEYLEGLEHIEKFRFIKLIYHLHKSNGFELKIKQTGEGQLRGVFSTRAPRRPNSIGISVVKLIRVEGAKIHIRDLDILDGTPLLDVKPYTARRY